MQSLRLRSAVAAACLVLTTTSGIAFAGTLLQDGNPVKPAALGSYGMQVTTDKALVSILPTGWNAVVSPDVTLNGKVSWAPTETWLDVLSRVADRANAGFLVDWNAHKVLVRPVPVTMQEGVARTEIHQAASTPLPALSPVVRVATVAPSAPQVSVQPVSASTASTTVNGVTTIIVPNPPAPPAPQPAVIQPAATQAPVQVAPVVAAPIAPAVAPHSIAPPAPRVNAGPSRSFSNGTIRTVVDAIAAKYVLTVTMNANDMRLPGPVTLSLNGDVAEDVRLLERALGPVAPLSVTYYKASHELIVDAGTEATFTAYEARQTTVEKQGGFFARVFGHSSTPAVSPAPTATVSSAPSVTAAVATPKAAVSPVTAAPTMVAVTTVPAVPAVAPVIVAPVLPQLVFDVAQGERLSVAITRFLKAQGWEISWQSTSDLEASGAMHVEAETISGVFKQVLPRLGLVADLYKANHVAVIRPASNDIPPQGAK